MNVMDELEDIVPILVTRNVDASSLAAKVTERDFNTTLRFDPEWGKPFGDSGFVLIRKGGAILRARAKYATYGVVYGKQTFDTTVDQAGKPRAKPLTYLTPTHKVVPGEGAYAEGAARLERRYGGLWGRVKRDFTALPRVALPIGACVAGVYLLVAVAYGMRRYVKRQQPCLTGYGLGFGLFHFAATLGWICLICGNTNRGDLNFCWSLLALATLAQAGGLAFIVARRRDDYAARQRGIKWIVAAPLIAIGSLLMMAMLGVFAQAD
jgi:hypothetical protein